MRDALERPRRSGASLRRRCGHVDAVTERQSTRNRCERVVNMGWTNQRRVKIAFARGRDETKPHSTQRKLRIARSHISLALHRITNHLQTIFLQARGKFNAIWIVDVDDGVSGPRSQTTIKQSLFRVPVVLHRLVVVEMIAREVRENSD